MNPDDDVSALFPAEVVVPRGRKYKTGSEKKQARNALPRVFFVMMAGSWFIDGAVLVAAAYSTIPSNITFHIKQYVAFGGTLHRSTG